MTECEVLSERMPVVARGADTWSASEAAHLASCPECHAEWRVVQLGVVAAAPVRIDSAAIADQVLARLRQGERQLGAIRAIPWRGGAIGLVAAAAAVVLMITLPGGARTRAAVSTDTATSLAILPELQALTDSQLVSVQRSLGPTAADAAPGLVPHLEDLTEAELEELVRSEGGQ